MNSLSWPCVGVREVGNEFKFEFSLCELELDWLQLAFYKIDGDEIQEIYYWTLSM